MLKLLKNAEVYSPAYIGQRDILIADGRIAAIAPEITFMSDAIEVIAVDLKGKRVMPGLIDAHVHICGGGGEGGFRTRTPELVLSDMIRAGVTTVVGCLGTDGVARSMENLIAKTKALKEEGVSAYCYTGSYSLPLVTLTGDIRRDIMMVEEVIGTGEIAVSDHRSSAPSKYELAKMAAESRLGGILSGKSGVVNLHLGDGEKRFEPIYEVLSVSDIPIGQFLPTHVNRNGELFNEAVAYALRGGRVDITTSTIPQFIDEGEVPAGKAVKMLLEAGVPLERITMTSDGQGSLPSFDANGNCNGLTVGSMGSLYDAVLDAVKTYGVALEEALTTITTSPAMALGLAHKGRIEAGMDADLIVAEENGKITDVMALGKWMMQNEEVIVKGTFE